MRSEMAWYAERRVPECWVVEEIEGRDEDAVVRVHRLVGADGAPDYEWERTVLLSGLEAEHAERNRVAEPHVD